MSNTGRSTTINPPFVYAALVVMAAICLLNGFIKEFYLWAEPLAEAMALIFIPVLIYTTGAILKNNPQKENRQAIFTIAVFMAVAALNIAATVQISLHSGYFLLSEGRLTNNSCTFFVAFFFVYEAALTAATQFSSRRPRFKTSFYGGSEGGR